MGQTICIFGDSITWGAWDPGGGGWVTRLRHYFETNDIYDVYIYNLGVSGDNTNDLLQRFKLEASRRKANIIMFAIGANDSLYTTSKNSQHVPIDKFQNNLKQLISQAKELSQQIVFIGLTGVDDDKIKKTRSGTDDFYDNKNITIYNSAIKEISAKYKLPFIDLFNILQTTDFYDGLHPNSDGHKKIFLQIKKFLLSNKIIQ